MNSGNNSNNGRKWQSGGFMAQLKTCGPYRANDGLILGVAKGLADHFGWSLGLVRLVIVLTSIFLFFWPTLILYIVAALLMGPAPTGKLDSQEERDIWLYAQMDPQGTLNQLGRRAAQAENRLRRLEDYITSKEFDWQRRLNNGL